MRKCMSTGVYIHIYNSGCDISNIAVSFIGSNLRIQFYFYCSSFCSVDAPLVHVSVI